MVIHRVSARRKLRVVVLALTGFGNPVLKELLADGRIQVKAVFTVRYSNPFPYYAEQQLGDLCKERRVLCYDGVKVTSDEGLRLLHSHSPDLIIVSTFKEILTQPVLGEPSLGVVNIHPSLLPKYRGPCPTNAALLNNDKVTGVTIHYVTEKVDKGAVLLQRATGISDIERDGDLRLKLARLAGRMMPDLIDLFADFSRPCGRPQACSNASLAPRMQAADGYLNPAEDFAALRNRLRACYPLPGANVLFKNRKVQVNGCELFHSNRAAGVVESETMIEVVRPPEGIRFYKDLSQPERSLSSLTLS
ncbi:MAG: formyltransferase family protein [Acidobacteriota bacterium]